MHITSVRLLGVEFSSHGFLSASDGCCPSPPSPPSPPYSSSDRALRLGNSIGVVFHNQPKLLQSCTHASVAATTTDSTSAPPVAAPATPADSLGATASAEQRRGGTAARAQEAAAEAAAEGSSVTAALSTATAGQQLSTSAAAAAAAAAGGRGAVTSSAASEVTSTLATSVHSASTQRPAVKADAKFMWHTTEPLRVFVHPLALYAG